MSISVSLACKAHESWVFSKTGGAVKVSASIEDPSEIKKILDHLAQRAEAATPVFRPFARAPPPTTPFPRRPGRVKP